MKRGSLSHLTPNERQALDAFVEALKREADGRILLAALFGSKARGDFSAGSDVDILIVTDADPRELDRQITGLKSKLDLAQEIPFNEFVFSRERWADFASRHAAFWQNIQRDGVSLLRAPTLPDDLSLLDSYEGDNGMADHRPDIQRYMRSAREALTSAQNNYAQADYRTAVNRAYYAVFYAANAMLATLGLQRSKHSGVKAAFQERFIKTGMIEVAYSKDYDETMKKRDIADYDVAVAVEEPFARDGVERARRFVERMEKYLKENSFL